MIVGLMETGEVKVYGSIDDALLDWLPFPADLASEVILLFDEDGTWLEPIERYAPRTWYRWYNKLATVELKRATNKNNHDTIGYLLQFNATSIVPNSFVKTLEELRNIYPYRK